MTASITSPQALERLVLEMGFLPFFCNSIPGFSVEEHTPPELWFSPQREGPWDWKGPVANGGRCVYGKFFQGKAGFVSLAWFPHLANYRRGGYDFEARYEDGLAPWKDWQIYCALQSHGSLLTRELKELCGYGRGGQRGFETVITRLQMMTYVNIQDFECRRDAHGLPYGWPTARYTTPEAQFGPSAVCSAYDDAPQASGERILAHLRTLLPHAEERQLLALLGTMG